MKPTAFNDGLDAADSSVSLTQSVTRYPSVDWDSFSLQKKSNNAACWYWSRVIKQITVYERVFFYIADTAMQ